MNANFIEKVTKVLVEEKARLERDMKDIGYSVDAKGEERLSYPESGGNSDDDNALEVTTLADEMSVVERLRSDLHDVTKALAALEKGTYGTCKYCKKEIDEKRLLARPTSSSCIECKKTLTQEM